MQVTEKIHTLKIPFTVPVSPEKNIDRSVYATLYIGEKGKKSIHQRIIAGISYLERIHNAVVHAIKKHGEEGIKLCNRVAEELGLPPYGANPLIAKACMSSIPVAGNTDLFDI